jgi:hypothetical protein
MKTEEEEESQYDFESRESSAEIVVLKKEFSFPLSPSSNSSTPSTPLTTWPYSTLLTPQSLAGISPSQLVLGVKVKRSSSPASCSAEPGAKRVKRKARSEEEKQASAYERTMRNRRAAQESRDRKKRQVEALEEENQRLLEENASMRRRIEQLEAQQSPNIADTESLTYPVATSPMYPISSPPTYSDTTSPSYPDPTSLTYTDDPIIKAEEFSPESFDSTFHPAAMEYDQQCPSISLVNTFTTSTTLFTIPLMNPPWTKICLRPLFSTLFSMMTRISLMSESLVPSPATFNSLNTGSLFTGAENGLGDDSRLWRELVL